ncbi:MAG: NAD(P)-dependent oxidoreductase [Candidatus Aenigmarchaeota archaeon]|nr:NAD(P)-dependent oxidoreductase [Candidatus Aenigmarchaeota archaeon]
MKILVTGGTGFIGKQLVKMLADEGHQVTAFAQEEDIDLPDDVKLVTGNITDKVKLRRAGGFEIVYHLAACVDEDNPEMWATNVTGTEKVIELCKEKKVKQIIFMSTAGVLGETTTPAKENTPCRPETKYDKSKAEAEKIIRASGIPYTIIRSPPVLGANVNWYKIFVAIKKGHPIIGSGKNKFHAAHVDDVVRLLGAVLNNKKAFDHTFHVACRDVMSYEDFYNLVRKQMKVRGARKYRSVKVAKLLSHLHALKSGVQAQPMNHHMSRQHINMVTKNCVLSIQKAKDILGFEPQYTMPAAVNKAYRDLVEF